MKYALDGNKAIAYGARLARPKVVAAYPITPQTPIVEELAVDIAAGRLDASYIAVESEHSALSAVVGAAITGVRVFTATAGAGLALMHEIVGVAAGNRLPVVMGISNRSLPSPWSLQADHSDSMAERDMGWLQLYAASAQESLDLIILGYALAEEVRLPVMICQDGFFVSHATSVVDVPEQEAVDAFLPSFEPGEVVLDPDNPMTINQLNSASTFTELKYRQQKALENALGVFQEVGAKYDSQFGRKYSPVQCVNCEGADMILVTLGSCFGAAVEAAASMNKEGMKVGIAKITLFRPFPYAAVRDALAGTGCVAVVDRSWGLGSEGPLSLEVKTALYPLQQRPAVYSFIAGLGGRDLHAGTFMQTVRKARELDAIKQIPTGSIWVDCKEVTA